MSTTRNITLALDEDTLREARVLAAQRGLSPYPRSCAANSLDSWSANAATPKRERRRFVVYYEGSRWVGGNFPREKNCTIVPSFVDIDILVYAEVPDTIYKSSGLRPVRFAIRANIR
jgi:hypothetical protein